MHTTFLRLPVRLLGILMALSALLALTPLTTHAVSCGTGNSGHCYGVASWNTTQEDYGAYTEIRLRHLTCKDHCIFIDDETWLVDHQSTKCQANSFQMCWIESGYIAMKGNKNPSLFWARAYPRNNNTFVYHAFGSVSSYGQNLHFMLIKDARPTKPQYLAFAYNDSQSILYEGVSHQATIGDNMQIGQELAGDSAGAFAPTAQFTQNAWATQPILPNSYVFAGYWQGTQGGVTSAAPPYAQWTVDPATSENGGTFTTNCC